MAENSKIEWTNHTANLWWGCTEVHEGCDNCYAKVWDNRWEGAHWGNDAPRRVINSVWKDLACYQRNAAAENKIDYVFVMSMGDIAEKAMRLVDNKGNELPGTTNDLRNRFFNEVVPNSPNLIFLLLSKRPGNFNKYTPDAWKKNPPANVIFGTSIVNQPTTDTLIKQLLQVPGKHFLSVEPQLDEISFRWAKWHDYNNPNNGTPFTEDGKNYIYHDQYDGLKGIDWVICGGESGHKKRPFNPDWARKLRDECKEAGVPFFMKQIDKVQPIPEDLLIKQFPKC
ncbi:MAG: DUF5131 family protein [Bacteroidota bacterium]